MHRLSGARATAPFIDHRFGLTIGFHYVFVPLTLGLTRASAASDRLSGAAAKRATIGFDVFVENALSPDCKTAAIRAAATLLLLSGAAGCGVLKKNEEVQVVVNQRVVGLPVGDFFEQYGSWKSREERADGSTEYAWISPIGATPNSGYYGLDDRTCTLHIVAARNGRVSTASVVRDMIGRTSTSRCGEMFKAR